MSKLELRFMDFAMTWYGFLTCTAIAPLSFLVAVCWLVDLVR